MKISILLPYKENFSPEYAGAVSLFVKDTTLKSKFKKKITVFGHTKYKTKFAINYINIPFDNKMLQSGSKSYVNKFLQLEEQISSDIIEIHNRPNYLEFFTNTLKAKIVLYFHNDPLSLRGSISKYQRENILNRASAIIFVSEWTKKRFFKKKDFRFEGYTNNPKFLDKQKENTETDNNERKKFNFKKGKKKIKNRNRPKSFKFKKHSRRSRNRTF